MNTEPIDSWNGRVSNLRIEGIVELGDSYGFCGLEAISIVLAELGLPSISKLEALEILSRTEYDVRAEGMSVYELECLLNMRHHTRQLYLLQATDI